MRAASAKKQAEKRIIGMGQLSLVEHALCPLDARASLVDNLVYSASYSYPAKDGSRQEAKAKVFSPLGLSASDELYLWGLLALSLQPQEPMAEIVATPHWILRQLGVINQGSKRGGRQYKQFADALRRLSVVNYLSDGFYDPVRAEHRRVSFQFFSYSLPVDPKSSRAWRIAWDPIFFDMVKDAAGQFRFDLAVYRELDAASRRLFLFASKVLSRRKELKAIQLESVAVDLLGFGSSLPQRQMKAKVQRCLKRLQEMHILADASVFKTSTGKQFVRMTRGRYFQSNPQAPYRADAYDSSLFETLKTIGFDDEPAIRLIRRFPAPMLSEWCDITQAAIERKGMGFFHESPMAFLVDSIDKASKGTRTPPDWWLDLKKAEERKQELSGDGKKLMAKIRSEVFQSHFPSEPELQIANGNSGATASQPASIRDILSAK